MRSQLKKEMWQDEKRRATAKENMKIKFDNKCISMILEKIKRRHYP